MGNFNINIEKAINSLLYVVDSLTKADTHKTYKILYFADQKHLVKYGRPIIGDTYVKMNYGPVPSFVRNVVDENIEGLEEVVAKYNRYYLKNITEYNLDYLSESEIECLNESINENKDLSFAQLTDKSHDKAYHDSTWHINYIDIAKATGLNEKSLNYINQQSINDSIELR